jgi:hypothetical protein
LDLVLPRFIVGFSWQREEGATILLGEDGVVAAATVHRVLFVVVGQRMAA